MSPRLDPVLEWCGIHAPRFFMSTSLGSFEALKVQQHVRWRRSSRHEARLLLRNRMDRDEDWSRLINGAKRSSPYDLGLG